MGQSQSSSASDFEFNGDYDFFRRLDLASAKKIINKWCEGKINGSQRLSWREYFTVLLLVQEELESDKDKYARKNWSPVCNGYAMVKKQGTQVVEESNTAKEAEKSDISDAHTDDEESELYSEENNRSERLELNPQIWSNEQEDSIIHHNYHPIFLGYSTESLEQRESWLQDEKNKVQEREDRAMERAISARSAALNQMEDQFRNQKQNREKKIEQIKNDYEKEQIKRRLEYEKSTKDLDVTLVGSIKDQYEKQEQLHQLAYSREIEELIAKNELKSVQDMKVVDLKRQELSALVDSKQFHNPIGNRLEEFSRAEILRCSDVLGTKMSISQKLSAELMALKAELNKLIELDDPKVLKSKQFLELRSMVNVAETRLKESLKGLLSAKIDVEDSEALLLRATKLKKQEEDVLPLFQSVAELETKFGSTSSGCRAMLLFVAMLLLAKGTFEQKCNSLFALVENSNGGLFDIQFVLNVGSWVFYALQALGLVRSNTQTADVENKLIRGFLSFSVNFKSDFISEYEIKLLVANIVSKDVRLMQVFGYNSLNGLSSSGRSGIGNYQLSNMTSIGLIGMEMVDKGTVINRIHYELQRYKITLESARRRSIHDQAVSQGQMDNYRADYSKFFTKKEKTSSYYIPPLNTGIYTSTEFYRRSVMIKAVLKIQSYVRLLLDRKLAEKESKRLAYMEAKLAVIKQLKNRILKEFQQREATKGMAKMKWDTEVRMKQAKLRSAGQNVSRSETVLIMIEEAMASAKAQIDDRFKHFEPETPVGKVIRKTEDQNSLCRLFGLPSSFDVSSNDGFEESERVTTDAEAEPLPNDEDHDNDDDGSALQPVNTYKPEALLSIFQKYYELQKFGQFGELSHVGEEFIVRMFRLKMSAPEVSHLDHLFYRLRKGFDGFTEFKVRELLGEFPSKRLLVRYISKLSDEDLAEDLHFHFKFRNVNTRGKCMQLLRNIVKYDMEAGVVNQRGRMIESVLESFLIKESLEYFQFELKNNSRNLSDKSDEDDVKEEEKRLLELEKNAKNLYSGTMSSIQKDRGNARRAALALKFVEHQLHAIHTHPIYQHKMFSPALRYEWSWRVAQARKQLLSSITLSSVDELKSIVDEFNYFASSISKIIVDELFKPECDKSIQIVSRKPVNGRSSSVGRGIDGFQYVFQACNIFFHVALDYDGIFNGSDEFSSKVAGKERLGSELLFDLEITKFYPSLVTIVDYFGFRIVATSRLPIVHLTFGDDGLVQSEYQELLHGMLDDGQNFINKSKRAQDILKMVGVGLNLREHKCKGKLDPAPSTTYAARLKVYKGNDGNLYARQYSSLFVHELPHENDFLCNVPRNQSMFWRFFRPELIMNSKVTSQSVDVGTIITADMDDEKSDLESLDSCTSKLMMNVKDLAENLLDRNYALPFTVNDRISLNDEFHRRGINMRYLGMMRSLLWRKLPGKCSLFHHENFLRTTVDLRVEIINGENIKFNDSVFAVRPTSRNKSSFNRLPLDKNYDGDSIHKIDAFAGSTIIDDDVKNHNLSVLLLAEMISRCAKSNIRLQLRQYNERNKCVSSLFFRELICNYLNMISGSSLDSEEFYQDIIFPSVLERFGQYAIWPHERSIFIHQISCARGYIVRRIMEMMGFRINFSCLSLFEKESTGFTFNRDDISDPLPLYRSSISDYPYLQGSALYFAAEDCQSKSYFQLVRTDSPLVFYSFAERRGSRLIHNHGSLGSEWAAALSDGCLLELPGPIRGDIFIKAIGFRSGSLSTVDVRYDQRLIPINKSSPFSFEIFFRSCGAVGLQKTVVTSGRYSIRILRDNHVVVSLYEELFPLNIKLDKISDNSWVHMVVTFDGLFLRIYQNGIMRSEVESPPIIDRKRKHFENEHIEKLSQLRNEEKQEKESLREKVIKEANLFFQSKDGVTTLKRMTQVILDLEEEDVTMVDDGLTGIERVKQRKANALKKAKEKYIEESIESRIREVGIRFKQLFLDLEDQRNNKIRDGKLRSYEPIRVGASLPDANNRGGSDYFDGDISCFSVYDHCLTPDRIRAHYLSSTRNVNQDAQRLFAKCVSCFNTVMMNVSISNEKHANYLDFYARSICFLMRFEPKQRDSGEMAAIIVQLLSLIETFGKWKKLEPIAQILNQLPRDQEFAEIVVEATLTMKQVDKNFLSKSSVLKRKTLINFPFEFALISPNRPQRYYDAAAFIFQEVVRDIELMFIYGDIDLRWIGEIRSSKMVIALVRVAYEDRSMKIVKLSEFFNGLSADSLLGDDDVQVLSQYLPLSEGFDFSHCKSIGNDSMESIARLGNVRVLILDQCSKITDNGFLSLKIIANRFETLSLEHLGLVSDDAFAAVFDKCNNLVHLNLNRCHGVSMVTVINTVRHNINLLSLALSGIQVNDEYLVKLAAECSKCRITKLDLSCCPQITDLGLIAIADACGTLKSINLLQNSRLSTEGVRSLCSKCWNLENIQFEELFLITDDIFLYSPTIDGRAAANERMLANLQDLNLKGCDMLSDNALFYLSERCRRVLSITLNGCKRVSDKGLAYLCDPLLCPSSSQPFCLTLRSIDISYVTNISSNALLETLQECKNLESFFGSGLVRIVDDQFLKRLGQVCPSIQKLGMNLCIGVTDVGLCSIAENLWIEHIELSGCYKISDIGVEVLASCCTGLRVLDLTKTKRITKNAVEYIKRNCPNLVQLEV